MVHCMVIAKNIEAPNFNHVIMLPRRGYKTNKNRTLFSTTLSKRRPLCSDTLRCILYLSGGVFHAQCISTFSDVIMVYDSATVNQLFRSA